MVRCVGLEEAVTQDLSINISVGANVIHAVNGEAYNKQYNVFTTIIIMKNEIIRIHYFAVFTLYLNFENFKMGNLKFRFHLMFTYMNQLTR